MKTISIYSFNELSPEAQAAAHKHHLKTTHDAVPHQDEIIDSLCAVIKAAGFILLDGQLGAYSYNWLKLADHDSLTLSGQAALDSLPPAFHDALSGMCAFTGVCFDDAYIKALQKAFADGQTLRQAFEGLAQTCDKLLEAEYDYAQTFEYFASQAEADDYEFLESGRRV